MEIKTESELIISKQDVLIKKRIAIKIPKNGLQSFTIDFQIPVRAVNARDKAGKIKATKQGTACAKTIVGVLVSGDASIQAAKKAGKISRVSTVDYHTKGYYPFVGETCIIVTGQ